MSFKQTIFASAALLLAFGCSSNREGEDMRKKSMAAAPSVVQTAEPPAKAWSPAKSDLPPDFVETVRFLQAHGLADPRGGKFVLAKLPQLLYSDGLHMQPPPHLGWTVSNADGSSEFVSCDGLSFLNFSKPQPVDVKAFVEQTRSMHRMPDPVRALDDDLDMFLDSPTASTGQDTQLVVLPLPCIHLPKPPDSGSRQTRSAELSAAVFLVAGITETSKSLLPATIQSGRALFVAMASELLNNKWMRALDSYSRGEDASALNLFQELAALRPIYESGAATFAKPTHSSKNERGADFDFLNQIPQLIVECHRRLAGKPTSQLSKSSDPLEVKIGHLEDAGLPFGQNQAYVSPAVIAARQVPYQISEVGSSAIPILIECLSRDSRMSRIVSSDGGQFRVQPVRELALREINYSTGASFHSDYKGDLPTAETVSSWWEKNRNARFGDRIFNQLADDGADDVTWAFAAKKMSGYRSMLEIVRATERRMALAIFKSRTNPSASELMIRRITQLIESPLPHESRDEADLRAKLLYECLNRLNPEAVTDSVRKLSDHLVLVDRERQSGGGGSGLSVRGKWFDQTDPDLMALLERRIEAGDSSVSPIYRSLLVRPTKDVLDFNLTKYRFFYHHRNDIAFAGLAKQLFLDSETKGMVVMNGAWEEAQPLALLALRTPLVNLPEEQDAVSRLLHDKKPIGKATAADHQVSLTIGNDPMIIVPGSHKRQHGDHENFVVRVCDYVGWQAEEVLRREHLKTLEFDSAENERDAAIQALIALLATHRTDIASDRF